MLSIPRLKDNELFEAVERIIHSTENCPLLPPLPVSWHLTAFAQYMHHLIEYQEYSTLANYQSYFVKYRSFLTPHLQILCAKRHLFTHIDELGWICRHFPDLYDPSGFSILYMAYMFSLSNTDVTRLIEHGASIHIQNRDDGVTVLMIACLHGDIDVIKFYLAQDGIRVDQQDYDGFTAAIYAAESGHNHVLQLLQDAGADFSIRNKKGMCVLDYLAAAGSAAAAASTSVPATDTFGSSFGPDSSDSASMASERARAARRVESAGPNARRSQP